MMDNRRRKLGRFGLGQRLASAAAIAIMAVSPAIGSFADVHLDGVALAIVGTIVGGPVSAQECTDRDGDERVCTVTEDGRRCLAAARDSAGQCRDATAWWARAGCYVILVVDTAACTIDFIGDVFLPFG